MRRVRVTELSALAFCEKQLALSWVHPKEYSFAQRRGIEVHEKLAQAQKQGAAPKWDHAEPAYSGGSGSSSFFKCYLVTHLYGEGSPEVERARLFRDEVLLASKKTAWLVPVYYKLMPWMLKSRVAKSNIFRLCADKFVMLMIGHG